MTESQKIYAAGGFMAGLLLAWIVAILTEVWKISDGENNDAEGQGR